MQSASRANCAGGIRAQVSTAKMANKHAGDDTEGEFEVRPGNGPGHAVDVLFGTPSILLEMTRENGRDRGFGEGEEIRRRKWVVGLPEVSLSDVEWVVVDGVNVFSVRIHTDTPSFGALLIYRIDPDLINQTPLLSRDVDVARSKPVPPISCAEPQPQ